MMDLKGKLPYLPEYDNYESWELLKEFCNRLEKETGYNAAQFLATIWGYQQTTHIYSFTKSQPERRNDWTWKHADQIYKATGIDWFVRWMAHRVGLRVVELDSREKRTLAQVVKETTDIEMQSIKALEDDGKYSPTEKAVIRSECLEAIEAIEAFMNSVLRQEKK